MEHYHFPARVIIWLTLALCATALWGALALLASVMPIDTGKDTAALAMAGILRGAV